MFVAVVRSLRWYVRCGGMFVVVVCSLRWQPLAVASGFRVTTSVVGRNSDPPLATVRAPGSWHSKSA
jgi:hypothetical protein